MILRTLAVAVTLVAGCGGTQVNEPTTGGASASADAGSCKPLASFADACPADWNAAKADKDAFCASRQGPDFDAFLSRDTCRGYLHYTKHLFDGGPRSCLYDVATGKLAAYRAHDGKAMFHALSCGVPDAEHDETGCSGATCS